MFPQPIKVEPGSHARFGASSSHRWTVCPASIRLQEGAPRETSAAAEAGTRAHAWLAYLLREMIEDAAQFVGSSLDDDGVSVIEGGNVNPMTEELAPVLSEAVAYVLRMLRPEDELFIERTWALPDLHASAFGTADIVIRSPDGNVRVIDYKNGRAAVPVHGNTQLMFYGLASRGPGGSVTGVILQNWDGRLSVKEATYSEDELANFLFAASVAAAAADTEAPVAGPHCKYCRAAATCPAIVAVVDEVTSAPLATLTPKTAPAAMARAAAAAAYASAVEEQTYAMAMRGQTPEGYKLVAGRSSREWITDTAPEEIAAVTGAKLQRTEWLSVAQAEKVLRKLKADDILPSFVAVKEGRPKLVPADHSGKEVTPHNNNFVPINV